MSTMRVAELWRYPVKSLAGEALDSVALTRDGVPGDRQVQVRDGRGKVLTARRHPRLLGFAARLGPDGEPFVNGRPWRAPEVTEALGAAVGAPVRLTRDEGPDRFDVLPLLVATDGVLDLMGMDRRRFRPNLLIAGAKELAEREWPGRRLRVGRAVIALESLRARCVMTTYDPDTLEQDPSVLRRIVAELDGQLGLDAYVVEPGRVTVGDPVELL
jgi:uncharacterized protein YcbX